MLQNSSAPVKFFRAIARAREPKRPDRTGSGILPMRAARYCESVTSATAFGWWLYPPLDCALMWDGTSVLWRYGDSDWLPLTAAQFPDFASDFNNAAPTEAQGCSPPFLTALLEPGLVQIWTGYFARTAPGWSLLVREPVNFPATAGCRAYEGIIEADRWFAPLFANVRLTATHRPVELRGGFPLVQVQPLLRTVYADGVLDRPEICPSLAEWEPNDWRDFLQAVVRPTPRPSRPLRGSGSAAAQRGGLPLPDIIGRSPRGRVNA